jgi:hypothetical protein
MLCPSAAQCGDNDDPPYPAPVSAPLLEAPALPTLDVEPDAFFRAEVATVFPHIDGVLRFPVMVGNAAVPVALSSAPLNPTVSPLFQLGAFRFGPGYGELAFTYRFIGAEGNADRWEDSLGFAHARSRLSANLFDFDYLRRDVTPNWGIQLDWYVGARVQFTFFDTEATAGPIVQTANTDFVGAGPRAGLRIARPLGFFDDHRLALFTRLETAMVIGYNVNQNFSSASPGAFGGGSQQATIVSPSVAVQVGVSYSPPRFPALSGQAGYQFEEWYQLGLVGASRGDVYLHGFFLGGAWNF